MARPRKFQAFIKAKEAIEALQEKEQLYGIGKEVWSSTISRQNWKNELFEN